SCTSRRSTTSRLMPSRTIGATDSGTWPAVAMSRSPRSRRTATPSWSERSTCRRSLAPMAQRLTPIRGQAIDGSRLMGLSGSDNPSAGDLLRDVPVYDLAEHIVDVATERAGCRVGLYVVDVGGDWFDISTSSSGAWLAVGDAVGKGMVAAALSALAVSAQRSVRQAGGSLDDATWAIHEAVREGSAGNAFMTLVLAEWDARD